MQLNQASKHRHKACQSRVPRQGFSIVEFIGCLVALCGGVVMGSMYLGIDVQGMAVDVLQSSQVLQHKDSTILDTAEDQPSPKTEASSHGQEPANPKGDQDANSNSASPAEKTAAIAEPTVQAASASKPSQEFTENEREKATLTYWKALTACLQEEMLGRQSGFKNFGSWQLLDYLTYRLEGHQSVVNKIKQLEENGVDQRVTFYAKQVLAWHLAGVKLNQRALGLITDGPQANLTGPVAQSWQSAATQHRMEEKLVQEKHLSVASYLAHTYKTHEPSDSP